MQEYIAFFQENMILSLVWVGILIALIMNIVKSSTAAYKEITASQTTYLMNREQGVVVDIRSKEDFRKGHITDAVHILPSDIEAGNLGKLEIRNLTQLSWYARQANHRKKVRTFPKVDLKMLVYLRMVLLE